MAKIKDESRYQIILKRVEELMDIRDRKFNKQKY